MKIKHYLKLNQNELEENIGNKKITIRTMLSFQCDIIKFKTFYYFYSTKKAFNIINNIKSQIICIINMSKK